MVNIVIYAKWAIIHVFGLGSEMKAEDVFLVLSYHVYSKQPIFVLTQEWLREDWSPRQGICLFTPCVGYFTSFTGIDSR